MGEKGGSGSSMQVIICYDISDNRIRYRMVKYLEKFALEEEEYAEFENER